MKKIALLMASLFLLMVLIGCQVSPEIYTVTFKDHDQTVLKEEKVQKGHDATEPKTPSREGYTFVGWDKDFKNITENIEVKAVYKIIEYQVVFKDYDGTVIKTQKVEYNKNATAPEEPSREGYTFKGWSESFEQIKKDTTITASYEKNPEQYSVVYLYYDQIVLKSETVETLKSVTPPDPPTREGYTFIKWDKEATNVNENLEINAVYSINKYEVIFKNEDGTILQTSEVAYGNLPLYKGETPTKTSTDSQVYIFTGWDKTISEVTKKVVYTAVYDEEVRKYEVTFKNEDGTILQTSEVAYGNLPLYKGETPTKTSTDSQVYIFTGWDKTISEVTETIVYTAVYDKEVRKYEVTFKNEDGTTLQTLAVAYGDIATYTGETPTKTATNAYHYKFIGWDKEFTEILFDTEYTAIYQEVRTIFTIGFDTKDGHRIDDITGYYGDKIELPTPSRDDEYGFNGWIHQGEMIEEFTITEDTTLEVQWNEVLYHYVENSDGTLKITGASGYPSKFVIPQSILGKKVTIIGESTFIDKRNAIEIILSNTIITIERDAFPIKYLEEIIITRNVKDIHEETFLGSMIKNIYVDSKNIHYSSVEGVLYNKEKTELIKYPEGREDSQFIMPSGVKKIRSYAIAWNDFLKNIILPTTVETIETSAFAGLSQTKTIHIPSGVKNIKPDAFSGLPLENIYVDENNPYYTSINGVLYNKNQTILLIYPRAKKNTSFIIEEGVLEIYEKAFSGSVLKYITIASSVYKIGFSAFQYSALEEIAFKENSKIESITEVLLNMYNLKSLILPNTIKKIEVWDIYDMLDLKYLYIPKSVEYFDMKIMNHLEHLVIDIDVDNPYYLIENQVLFNKEKTELIAYSKYKTETIYEVPRTVEKIKKAAFSQIELEKIFIHNQMRLIEEFAFDYIIVDEIIFEENSVIESLTNVFLGAYSIKRLRLPDSLKQLYAEDIGTSILEYLFIPKTVSNTDPTIFQRNITTIEIEENGLGYQMIDDVLYSGDLTQLLIYGEDKKELSFIIPEGVVEIAEKAFYCNKHLRNLTIPNTVKIIGKLAFSETVIERIDFQEGSTLERIEEYAFFNTATMEWLIIPTSVVYIEHAAFGNTGLVIYLEIYFGEKHEWDETFMVYVKKVYFKDYWMYGEDGTPINI